MLKKTDKTDDLCSDLSMRYWDACKVFVCLKYLVIQQTQNAHYLEKFEGKTATRDVPYPNISK